MSKKGSKPPAKFNSTNLDDYTQFIANQWVKELRPQFKRHATLAKRAIKTTFEALEILNDEYYVSNSQALFTSIEGRVKKGDSFFRKLHKRCLKRLQAGAFTQEMVQEEFNAIVDVAGVRVSCPYFDDVTQAVNEQIRPRLTKMGFGTNLFNNEELRDRNRLEDGDEFGYRAYHFFIEVPAVVDIFGKVAKMVCEVQARSELQNVWAVKSHDLLYKPDGGGWQDLEPTLLENVKADMKAVSNSLRAADQYLSSIRERLNEARKQKKVP